MSATATAVTPKWTDAETLNAVRPRVRELLMSVPAYAQLPPQEQQQIAKSMVQVAAYIANPEGVLTEAPKPSLARAQAEDPVEATKRRLSQAPGQVGKD